MVKNIGQTVYNRGKVSRKGETTYPRGYISPLERDSLCFVFVEMIRDKALDDLFRINKRRIDAPPNSILFPFISFPFHHDNLLKIFDSSIRITFRIKLKKKGMKWNMFIDRKNSRFDACLRDTILQSSPLYGEDQRLNVKLNSR